MPRFISRLIRLAAIATIVACSALATAQPAQAAPNCPITHDLHPYSDNTEGGWQLELEARCREFQHSGVTGITWTFRFWAETYDGGRVLEVFNGDPISERRSLKGQHHYVGVGAPHGFPRYCYTAHVEFEGLRSVPSRQGQPLEYALGTHCENA
jgi:hypothetical protein